MNKITINAIGITNTLWFVA